MGLDSGLESMAWRFSWDGRVTWEHGLRGKSVDCASQMGYKTLDVDAPNVKIERCEKTFTHISWIKLWTVRLDVELKLLQEPVASSIGLIDLAYYTSAVLETSA